MRERHGASVVGISCADDEFVDIYVDFWGVAVLLLTLMSFIVPYCRVDDLLSGGDYLTGSEFLISSGRSGNLLDCL